MNANSWRYRLLLLGSLAGFLPAVTLDAATLTVTSSADAGGTCPGADCTLRQAIAVAAPGDTIDFAAGITTIGLTSGELLIDKNLTIAGPGPDSLTVRKISGPYRVLKIASSFEVAISGLTVSNGSAGNVGEEGGGIYNQGALTLTNSAISNNFSGTRGGGIANQGTLMIVDSSVSGNSGQALGGGPGAGLSNTGTTTIVRSSIANNTGTGGVYNAGMLTVSSSTIANNSGRNSSGGLNSSAGTATITNSTISGNTALFPGIGGGIRNGGAMTISNSTISGNTIIGSIQGSGGGIYNTGTITITGTTISENSSTDSAGIGGGIYAGGTVICRSTIIASNTAPNGPDVAGTLTSQDFNLIGNGSGATITPIQPADQIGTAAAPIDPQLGSLKNNGGPTLTRALSITSPAVDKGHSSGLATDQRGKGFPRTFDDPFIANAFGGDGTDIGAVEIHGPIAVSRKTHGAGMFDIDLPLAGPPGIECRRGAGSNFGNHQVIATFADPVTVNGVQVTSVDGMATATRSVSGNVVTINLSSVSDAQIIAITLAGVTSGMNTADVTIPMGVLLGDTNGDGLVNAADVLQTRSRSGQTLTTGNFRSDVNIDNVLNSGDVLIVRSRSGTSLP